MLWMLLCVCFGTEGKYVKYTVRHRMINVIRHLLMLKTTVGTSKCVLSSSCMHRLVCISIAQDNIINILSTETTLSGSIINRECGLCTVQVFIVMIY